MLAWVKRLRDIVRLRCRVLLKKQPNFDHKSFMGRALNGEFEGQHLEDVVDDAIEAWHFGSSKVALRTYLGLSWDEYGAWVENRVTLQQLVAQRLATAPVDAYVTRKP